MAKRVLNDYKEVSLKLEELGGRVDFGRIFRREGPVHIEIGSGKGTFLVSQAGHAPDINFLGIEWSNKYYRFAVDRIGRWGLKNVRIIRADAAHFLSEYVPDSSVDWFHVYFPDPWPKKRHHKRRFVCAVNVGQMVRCLKKGGIIQIATDYVEYFEQIKAVVDGEKGRLEAMEFIRAEGAENGEIIGTNYERKYVKDKRSIYAVAVRKFRKSS